MTTYSTNVFYTQHILHKEYNQNHSPQLYGQPQSSIFSFQFNFSLSFSLPN